MMNCRWSERVILQCVSTSAQTMTWLLFIIRDGEKTVCWISSSSLHSQTHSANFILFNYFFWSRLLVRFGKKNHTVAIFLNILRIEVLAFHLVWYRYNTLPLWHVCSVAFFWYVILYLHVTCRNLHLLQATAVDNGIKHQQ